MTTRRTFLTTSSLAAMATLRRRALGAPTVGHPHHQYTPGSCPRATDPTLKELAMRALDAAKAAGASYADVRFTTIRQRSFVDNVVPIESEQFAVGVRALAKGTWGFAAHSNWNADLVAQLGRQAAEQAKTDTWSDAPPITLVDHPPVALGNWVTPIKRDPFTVPPEETAAWIQALARKILQVGGRHARLAHVYLTFERQERTFASTMGAYTTQTIYTSLGSKPHESTPPSAVWMQVKGVRSGRAPGYPLPFVTPTGAGYEVLEEAKVLDHMQEWFEVAQALANAMPFEKLGEYDVVFDGAAMAAIVDGTFGAALEYDRAAGYEANAGGTSYLAPPLQVLGTAHAPAAVTITGDRTLARGCATVGWDDEGIASRPFPLVKGGVVVDYATSREFAAELAPWYTKRGVPVQSNGCAASESASTVPLVYSPNLVLQPAAQDTTLEQLIAGIDDGLLVCGGGVQMDMQQSSGRGEATEVYLIKHGKRTEPVDGAVYNFRSAELWKNLVALGGASTAALRGMENSKGQPNQTTLHSAQAPAAHFRKVQVDNTKQA